MNANVLNVLGRVLIAALFIPAGIGKLFGFSGTVAYIQSAGLPLASLGAVIAIVVELVVAGAFLLGYRTKYTAIVLAVFTLVAAFLFHPYWAVPAEMKTLVQIMFYKNFAIAGGLLAFAAYGAGSYAVGQSQKAQ